MSKKVFSVPDMHCSACVMILEGLEDSLTGVQSVLANYQKKQMEITYDEKKLSEATIITAAEELGYTAIPANP